MRTRRTFMLLMSITACVASLLYYNRDHSSQVESSLNFLDESSDQNEADLKQIDDMQSGYEESLVGDTEANSGELDDS